MFIHILSLVPLRPCRFDAVLGDFIHFELIRNGLEGIIEAF